MTQAATHLHGAQRSRFGSRPDEPPVRRYISKRERQLGPAATSARTPTAAPSTQLPLAGIPDLPDGPDPLAAPVRWHEHGRAVSAVRWASASADGRPVLLASAGMDGTVRLWSPAHRPGIVRCYACHQGAPPLAALTEGAPSLVCLTYGVRGVVIRV